MCQRTQRMTIRKHAIDIISYDIFQQYNTIHQLLGAYCFTPLYPC